MNGFQPLEGIRPGSRGSSSELWDLMGVEDSLQLVIESLGGGVTQGRNGFLSDKSNMSRGHKRPLSSRSAEQG